MGAHKKDLAERASTPLSTRTTTVTAERFKALADDYKVSTADLLRWLIQDAVDGKYQPSHLARTTDRLR